MGMLADRKDRRARARAHDALVQTISQLRTKVRDGEAYHSRYRRLIEDEHDLSRVDDEYSVYKHALTSAQESILDDHFYQSILDGYYEPELNKEAIADYEALLRSLQTQLAAAIDAYDRGGGQYYEIFEEQLRQFHQRQQSILNHLNAMPQTDQDSTTWDVLNDSYFDDEEAMSYAQQQVKSLRPVYQQRAAAQAEVDTTTRQLKELKMYPTLFVGDEGVINLHDMTHKVEGHIHAISIAEMAFNGVLTAVEGMMNDEEALASVEDAEITMTAVYSKIRGTD